MQRKMLKHEWLGGSVWLSCRCGAHDAYNRQHRSVYNMCHFNYSNFSSLVCSRLVHRQQLFAANAMWFCSHNVMINVQTKSIATRQHSKRFEKNFCIYLFFFEWYQLTVHLCTWIESLFFCLFMLEINVMCTFSDSSYSMKRKWVTRRHKKIFWKL